MKLEKLKKAVSLAKKMGYIFIATADGQNVAHIAAAGKVELSDKGCIAVTEWFCLQTVANLQENKYASVVVWDPVSDNGYQLLGQLEKIEDLSILDGYIPEEAKLHLPQVERRLLIRVEKIFDFRRGPHSDTQDS